MALPLIHRSSRDETKNSLPVWFQPGRINDSLTPDNGVYARCLRDCHRIFTIGDLVAFVNSFPHNAVPPQTQQIRGAPTCICERCDYIQSIGCKDMFRCHNKAKEYLDSLRDKWCPLNGQPDLNKLTEDYETIQNTWNLSDNELLFTPKVDCYKDVANGFRILDPRAANRGDYWYLDIKHPDLNNRAWDELYVETALKHDRYAPSFATFGVSEACETPMTFQGRVPKRYAATQHTAIAIAMLRALEALPEVQNYKIHISSNHIANSLTSKLEQYEDMNWLKHDVDADVMRQLVSIMRTRRGLTLIKTYDDKSNVIHRTRAKDLALQSQLLPEPNEHESLTDICASQLVTGAKLNALTQSQIYQLLLYEKSKTIAARPATKRHLELAKERASTRLDYQPTEKTVWKSMRSKQIAHKKIRAFLWRVAHDALPCGKTWPNDPNPEKALCPTCHTRETPEHILTECPSNGQATIWALTRQALSKKGIALNEQISIGDILTCGLPPRNNAKPEECRLYTILVSEAAWLIWTLRCKWVMEDEGKADKRISDIEAENTWRKRVNTKVNFEILATNEKKYKAKSFNKTIVYNTWTEVVNSANKLAESLSTHRNTGVLVSIGLDRDRPPGRPPDQA
ncbi:hypothetical protein NMY22_g1747 [Coprinellus aureogranulatus]|nr:hypothetical protein NMY22_g1747 [Coprinellus aureogranulatus]